MQLPLELEDLAFPAALRAVYQGSLVDHLDVNQAFRDLFDLDSQEHSPSTFMGSALGASDDMDRRVAVGRERVAYRLHIEGRPISVEKSPIVRAGDVVAVLTVMVGRSGGPVASPTGPLPDASSEPITLLQIDGTNVRIISQNRASLDFSDFIESESIPESFSETAEQARQDLLVLAMRAIELQAPTVDELVIVDRHYSVLSEVISKPGVRPSLVSQTMTDVSDRSRSDWLEQLVDVAGAEKVEDAADLAFRAVRRLLGFDRSALLQFDGDSFGVFAATVEIDSEQSFRADRSLVNALRLPGVVRLSDSIADPALLDELGVVVGAALPVHADGVVWGALVIGHSSAHANNLTTLTLSMLESLGSTLGMVIGREAITRRLEESNRRLEAYAHAAAHDLRSPLRRIRSFSQLLQARLESEHIDRAQVADFAERIANGAERLDALLGSMLEHATVGNLAIEKHEYTDLQALAGEICQGISELSHQPEPSFTVGNLPEVRLTADVAERVLRKVIDTVSRYSPPERAAEIEIKAKSFDGGVRLVVADHGVGVGLASAARVFQVFSKVAGPDLATVERLVGTVGAKAWVESGVETGASFVLEFPIAAVRPKLVGFAERALDPTPENESDEGS